MPVEWPVPSGRYWFFPGRLRAAAMCGRCRISMRMLRTGVIQSFLHRGHDPVDLCIECFLLAIKPAEDAVQAPRPHLPAARPWPPVAVSFLRS